ncbi:MAG: ribbon-helix-helix protein, CopG family [Zetaproteobacteria bacterium]|nr:ribbon-helix-helix protein, CopG family [Zetaproteobacteria bacterium]
MGALSLRLPENLDRALSCEAELEMKPRSVVVRQALDERGQFRF